MKVFQTGTERYQPTRSSSSEFVAVDQRRLALVVGLVAICLPIVMLIASKNPWLPTCARNSISHYYYAPFMGSFFVGAMIFIGAYLLVYRGEDGDGAEYRLSSLAGMFAIGVGLFPTSGHGCDDGTFEARAFLNFSTEENANLPLPILSDAPASLFQMIDLNLGWFILGSDTIHYLSAVLLFMFLAWFCFAVFTSVEPHQRSADGALTSAKVTRNLLYRICGTVMITSIIALALSFALPRWLGVAIPWWEAGNWTFWFESFALWAFGLSWMVKGRFLGKLRDNAKPTL